MPPGDWRNDLKIIDDLMRAVSREADPQKMVRMYGAGVRRMVPTDGFLSLSRRGLESPWFRVTRSSKWEHEVNPWQQRDSLPLLQGGLLGELLYANEPRVVEKVELAPGDPAAAYLDGVQALMTLPQYDDGSALNMTLLLWNDPSKLPLDRYPNMVWQANLFGRATLNLVLRRELAATYEALDREVKIVGEIQRSLLPRELPRIPGLRLAAHYQTSRRAGGDYYDVFALPDGNWGLIIADVSGHGTPAAVMMAVTHAIAHSFPGPAMPPALVLGHLNAKLSAHYTADNGTFVTAFYAVIDPARGEMVYARAGHNPPRLLSGKSLRGLDEVGALPLGIDPAQEFEEATLRLRAGDRLLLYTDGVTEASGTAGEQFGEDRLDALLRQDHPHPESAVRAVVAALEAHCGGRPVEDDRTLLAAWVGD